MTRTVHLYLGLFISPFIVLFALSVIFLVHSWTPGKGTKAEPPRTVSNLQLPSDIEKLSGRPLIDALRPVLASAGVQGEINWVTHTAEPNRFIIPVTIPGRLTTVTIDVSKREATIESKTTGLADAAITLHKLPGPHLVGMRMNWIYIRLWSWFADATAYLLIVIPATGVYLWYASRSDRKSGYLCLLSGIAVFTTLIYALIH